MLGGNTTVSLEVICIHPFLSAVCNCNTTGCNIRMKFHHVQVVLCSAWWELKGAEVDVPAHCHVGIY